MALASQAALLDELMGVNRNSNCNKDLHWKDDSVCKYYLAGFCPHELFVNTKMSLGDCPKLHDCNLLTKYKNSSSYMKMGFEKLLKNFLSGFVRDVQRKIEINKSRLENGFLSGIEIAIQKRISSKIQEIDETIEMIEKLGNDGKIEECQYLHTQLEEKQKELKYDKIELENNRRSAKERQEDVCNICGAYISKNDPRNSIENHVSGRIHCGYVRINEILEDLNMIEKSQESSEKQFYRDDRKHRNYDEKYRERSRHRSRERRYKNHKHSRTSTKGNRNYRSRSKTPRS